MLEGSVPEFSGPLISQPSPQPASSAPTHNGYALAVRGVRFCGAGVRVAPAPKTSPALARPLAPPPRTPTVKPAAAPQRRRSTGGGRKAAGMTAGSTSLVTTPVPTPLPPDVTSRLKASMGEQRPRFCDRLNAMFKTGAATNDCDDEKDPYTFVESSTTSDINLLQRPLQQTIRTNGMVNRKTAASTPPSSVDVVKPKKRKVNNNAKSLITSATPANIQPKNIILTQQNIAALKAKAQQPSIVQMQPPKQVPAHPQQQTMMKPQNVVTKVQQTTTTPQQNTIKLTKVQQQIRQESTSLISASSPNATSILRTAKFAEHVNNNRRTSTDKINHAIVNNNLVTRVPVANVTSLAPPLAPLKSVAPEEEKTTMNQLQARIARNRVIGKHQHRNNKSTSSQSLTTANVSPQQLSKLKERSLLEEQLLLGIKQEKQQQTLVIPPQQQLKTVTKHFTFPMKSTGSMVTYKKVISQLQQPTPLPPPPPPPQQQQQQQHVLSISKKPGQIKVEENLSQHQTQIQNFVKLRNQEVAFRKDLFNHGLGIPENTMEKECSSFQRHWFLEHPPESSTGSDEREIRLARTKAAFRRRYLQLRKSVRSQSTSLGELSWKGTVQAQVKAARTQPNRMAALLMTSVPPDPSGATVLPRSRHRVRHRWAAPHNWQDLVRQEPCCFKECNTLALPLARHCLQHIMYNVDQQLFEYCTAKFADNTQCCVPVFDIQHELPLCLEHARKKDNYTKQTCDGKPKRSRKKAKPAAMTRPSKRGKKKRKGTPNPPVETVPSPVVVPQPQPPPPPPQKQVQQQQPLVQHHQQIQHQTLQSLLHHSQQLQLQHQQQQQQHQMPPLTMTVKLEPSHLMVHSPVHTTHIHSPADIVEAQGMVPMYMREDSLSQPGHDASLVDHGSDSEGEVAGLLRQVEAGGAGISLVVEEELPLEGAEEELAALPLEGAEELAQQASRLLEEDHDDLASVLSQIPAETFNELFNGERTGVYEPTREETEELERALAAVDKDVRSLEKLQRQHNSPLGASAASVLPAELVESILGGHLGNHLDDSLASLSRHPGVVKEEVVIDLMGTQHLVGVHDNVTSYQVHPSTDLHSQLLPNTQDALIQLDAAVFPPDAMSQLVPDLGHSQGGGATFLLPQQTHQSQGFNHNDVSALLHPSLMHQNRVLFQGLGNDAQQLMLTPAAVFGGGAAPPPTPNSVHQPAVANTPPFHHQNGYLQGNGQFDAKFACPLPSIPSPSMAPSQFTPASSPLTSNMSTQTLQQQQLHLQQQQQSQRHADS